MVSKTEKLLRSISLKDKKRIRTAIILLQRGETEGMILKKFKGCDNLFWVRIGDFRIIVEKTTTEYLLVKLERRGENTYKGLK